MSAIESSYLVLGSHGRKKEGTWLLRSWGEIPQPMISDLVTSPGHLTWFLEVFLKAIRRPCENKKLVTGFPFFKLPWETSSLPWGFYRDRGDWSRLCWVSGHNHITVIGRIPPSP